MTKARLARRSAQQCPVAFRHGASYLHKKGEKCLWCSYGGPFDKLSTRAKNFIKQQNIRTVEQLGQVTLRDLLCQKGVGLKVATEIVSFLWRHI